MKKILFYCIFSVLLIICNGCSNIQELDAWPFVYYEQDSKKQETSLDILTSFFSYRDTPKETTYAFRPFYVGELPKDRDFLQMMFLWPFGYWTREPNDQKIWILPFYYYRDIKNPDLGERDFDWFFLPFLALGGTDTHEGSYNYMTFWGNVKGLLGYDEIKATPFPFYVEARDRGYTTKGYLWPFFRFGEGDGKKFSFYCFFYSNYEKEGHFKRQSYLWPLIHYNQEDLHKKHPRTEFMFFPFYGQTKSDVSLSRTFLWPFFSFAHNTEQDYTEYNCPWPFFKYKKGNGINEFRIWPFYWKYEQDIEPQGKEDDLMIMWPIYWKQKSDYLTYEKESEYILPFYWHHKRKGKEANAVETERLKIWPFCSYEKKEDGTKQYQGLSLFWFEDYFPEGFKKAWQPFFTLFDYSTGPQGKENVTLLGPLYQYKTDGSDEYRRFLFFSYKNKPSEDFKRYSVLGGLFEYKNEQGEKKLKLLYIPITTWGEKKEVNNEETENNISSPKPIDNALLNN